LIQWFVFPGFYNGRINVYNGRINVNEMPIGYGSFGQPENRYL